MNVQRYLWLVTVMLIGALAGCLGGSGSSGFDNITENAAIQEAIDTQECQDFEGLVICPAEQGVEAGPSASPTPTRTLLPATPTQATPPLIDTPTFPVGTPTLPLATPGTTASPTQPPTVSPTVTQLIQATPTRIATATVPPPMQIETNLGPSSDINCSSGASCPFTFFFVAIGFPPDAMYRTAFRDNADQPWMISQPTGVVDSQPGKAAFQDQVEIDRQGNAPAGSPSAVQFAVLVFLGDPGVVPSSVSLLGDTGADFAYVLPPVPVSP